VWDDVAGHYTLHHNLTTDHRREAWRLVGHIVNLGLCNAAGPTGRQHGWEHAAEAAGLDPATLRLVAWHESRPEPNGVVAFFRVRPRDPKCWLVGQEG
jgi:hypothetical protein